jgi:hypothetical protein
MAHQNLHQMLPPKIFTETAAKNLLREEIYFCDFGNVVFHWGDFFETCKHIKHCLESNPDLMSDFQQREDTLLKLKLVPVWIKTESKIFQTTIYDFYERSIVNRSKLLSGINPFSPTAISFISGTGPFKKMSITDCLNKNIYRDFVIISLLKGRLPMRDYRIRLKSKILIEFGQDFRHSELIALEQMSLKGILLSMDLKAFQNHFRSYESFRLLLNYRSLNLASGMGLSDFRTHLSQYAFNLLYSSLSSDSINCEVRDFSSQYSFDSAKNQRAYIFLSYERLVINNPECVNIMKQFVEQTQEFVRYHYRMNELGESA